MPFALRTTVRHVRRRPTDAILNIVGLAVGLACFGFIALYVASERSVDQFHSKGDRVVRLSTLSGAVGDELDIIPVGPRPLAETVEAEIPGVEATVRMWSGPFRVRNQGQVQKVETRWADPDFFSLFSYEVVSGDPATALVEPNSVVLTESTAQRLTGAERPLGQIIETEEGRTLTVTAVVADPPPTHLPFEAVGSFSTLVEEPLEGWFVFDTIAYVLLEEGTDRAVFDEAVRQLAYEKNQEEFDAAGYHVETVPQALSEIYLGGVPDARGLTGDSRRLTILSIIGLFVLVVAVVNFINLATARSAERAQEVGMRKALGSGRSGLVRQFLTESVVLAVVAGILALGSVALGLPSFNNLVGADLQLGALLSPSVLAIGLAVMVGVGVLAGVYPALVLSQARPIETLRGRFAARGSGRLRQGLVVFQFAISISLLAAMIVASAQLSHMRNQPLGFDADHVALVSLRDASPELQDGATVQLKEAVEQVPGVEAASLTGAPPGFDGWTGQVVSREGAPEGDTESMEVVIGDVDYVETLGLEIVAGRDLDDRTSDAETAVLLNETAARQLGWTPEAAIGERIATAGRQPGEIVGVVRDYRHHSVQAEVGAQVLFARSSRNYLAIRYAPEDREQVLSQVSDVWEARVTGYPFQVELLEGAFDQQYASEERLSRAFTVFGILAVLVACLGLFGLAAHAVQKRTKEVGVRKVLGATVAGLVTQLSRDFAIPVIVGLAVAAPVTWWALGRWLEGFAERVTLTPVPFVMAGAAALALALVTVSVHTIRAASSDPIRALRSD